jgi:hypothetical protein
LPFPSFIYTYILYLIKYLWQLLLQLLLKECFKDGEGEGYVGLLKRRHVIDASLGETEWRGEDV